VTPKLTATARVCPEIPVGAKDLRRLYSIENISVACVFILECSVEDAAETAQIEPISRQALPVDGSLMRGRCCISLHRWAPIDPIKKGAIALQCAQIRLGAVSGPFFSRWFSCRLCRG